MLIVGVVSIIIIVGLFLSGISKNTMNPDKELKLTRASVDMFFNIRDSTSVDLPIYLKTLNIKVPENGYTSSKYDVMRNIADRIDDTWWAFGEGMVKKNLFGDVFVKLTNAQDRCFVQFNLTIDELDEEFTVKELIEFMSKNVYKVKSRKVKYCDDSESVGCISRDTPECIAKGGKCTNYLKSISEKVSPIDSCNGLGMYPYLDWSCGNSNEVCCLTQDMFYSYLEYIQKNKGLFMVPKDQIDKTIKKGDTYQILFKDYTDSSKWGDFTVFMLTGIGGYLTYSTLKPKAPQSIVFLDMVHTNKFNCAVQEET
jgi:hypothetical protein